MSVYRDLFSEDGNREQASVSDAEHSSIFIKPTPTLKTGTIYAVNTYDTFNASNPSSPNRFGKYISYDVMVSPLGVIVRDVPALGSSGHYANSIFPSGPPIEDQNTEETPFVIGQPVLLGFTNDSSLNPIIIGAYPSMSNGGSQTGGSSGEYPQKQGIFQGTSWKIDKNGNPTVNIISNGKLKVEVNGTPFITVDGANNLVDIGTGSEFGVLGNTLQTFLSSLEIWLDAHTHGGPPPLTPSPTPPTVTTTVLKVQ